MSNRRRILPIALASFVVVGTLLAADPPATINYQGVLRDGSDKPRNGTFDMVYRFFDAQTGGSEIVVDSHTAAGGSAVTVSNGLFNASLGGGTVTDGSGAGTYTSLTAAFRDYGSVWMGITIGAETLSPRVQIQSAPYALNASNLQGKAASSFLDTSNVYQTKAGSASFSGDTFFHPAVSGSSLGGANLGTLGSITSGVEGYSSTVGGYFGNGWGGFGSYATLANYAEGIQANGLETGGAFGSHGGTGTATLATGDTGISAYGTYPGSSGYFKDLVYTGEARIATGGQGILAFGAYNAGEFDSTTGYYAALGSGLYGTSGYFLDGNTSAVVSLASGDYGLRAYGTYSGFFYSYDQGVYTLTAQGSSGLTSNGTKNFVQNHPDNPQRVIVYSALEGSEAGTYTRGSGRTHGGESRIVLEPTFALTTDPDVGLTATVTARGARADLYVSAITTKELVVRSGTGGDVDFDYVVNGLRLGFESQPVIVSIDNYPSATVPALESSQARLSAQPEDTRASTPLARFSAERAALGSSAPDLSGARKLIADINSEEHTRFAKTMKPAAATHSPAQPPSPTIGSTPAISSGTMNAGSLQEGGSSSSAVPIEPEAGNGMQTAPGTFLISVAGTVEPGDVLGNNPAAPGTFRRSDVAADPGVVGIVAGADGSRFSGKALIALAGTLTRCKVDATYGPILVNDLLVASPTPGSAMAGGIEPRQGTVLGKALEPLSTGTGTILVLVMSR